MFIVFRHWVAQTFLGPQRPEMVIQLVSLRRRSVVVSGEDDWRHVGTQDGRLIYLVRRAYNIGPRTEGSNRTPLSPVPCLFAAPCRDVLQVDYGEGAQGDIAGTFLFLT